jgi:signal transduction histidine kinase
MVSVADTGIGIAGEDQDRVFDKFQQIGDILTAKPHGTGLGLAICKEIVTQHGGRIWVESKRGKGSIFRFVLPLTSQELRSGAPSGRSQETPSRGIEEELPLP